MRSKPANKIKIPAVDNSIVGEAGQAPLTLETLLEAKRLLDTAACKPIVPRVWVTYNQMAQAVEDRYLDASVLDLWSEEEKKANWPKQFDLE